MQFILKDHIVSGTNKTRISRRKLLKFGAIVLGTGGLTLGFGSPLLAEELVVSTSSKLTPDQALKQLMDGNKRYLSQKRQAPHRAFERIAEVANNQKPFAAVISCSDSRVIPEMIFDQGLGDLFVSRVAGNIATAEAIASHEYGVLELGVQVVMVLGHERCGAVKAALDGGEFPGSISTLITAIQPAVDSSALKVGDRWENAVKDNVILQVNRLKNSRAIALLIQQGKLTVVGGFYDLDRGSVTLLT